MVEKFFPACFKMFPAASYYDLTAGSDIQLHLKTNMTRLLIEKHSRSLEVQDLTI